MSQYQWEFAVYKETLQALNELIQEWRNGHTDTSDFDFLYQIEGLIDEVGLE
tara:strand:+ start:142 stop:297 length:156 start_codon:yes stop_codon:yes gene_type:complete